MSKQTAVEWLIEQIKGYDNDCEIFEEAKEMEQEQITDAFETGRRKGDWIFDGEKYYEETYKNENNV